MVERWLLLTWKIAFFQTMKLVQKWPILPLPIIIHCLLRSEGVITGFFWLDKAYMYQFWEIRGEIVQGRIPFKDIEIPMFEPTYQWAENSETLLDLH